MEGSAWLNFGPNFVYPPHQSMHLPLDMSPWPVSDLSPTPPLPEYVVETVISSGRGHLNLSKGCTFEAFGVAKALNFCYDKEFWIVDSQFSLNTS